MKKSIFIKNKNIALYDYLLSVLQKLEYIDDELLKQEIKSP